jgi:hypothetical protein
MGLPTAELWIAVGHSKAKQTLMMLVMQLQ